MDGRMDGGMDGWTDGKKKDRQARLCHEWLSFQFQKIDMT